MTKMYAQQRNRTGLFMTKGIYMQSYADEHFGNKILAEALNGMLD